MIWLENLVNRVAGWLRDRIQKRREQREIAATFPAGTRIVTTGLCCAMRGNKTVQGTIVDYILEAGDYHVILDHPTGVLARRAIYLCRRGFEPTGGRQDPAPAIADWWACDR